MDYVLIMAGGSGKRLWPLSRQGAPKQLLPLFDGKSLLQLACERVLNIVSPDQILICTGAAYADVVAEQLPDVPAENILGEPEGRDSLNAVAWPAAVLAARDPEAVMAVVTADQLISPVVAFVEALRTGLELARRDSQALITFGVVPTSPHTGYGYLHKGDSLPEYPNAAKILEFKEKPDLETAQTYLASGNYWWNAGMFVWRAQTLLDQLAVLQPETHTQVLKLAENPELLGEIYPKLLKISVDYAVMEPVSHGRTSAHILAVALPIDWADVGSYESLHEVLPHDEYGDAVIGEVVALDSANNLLINTQADSALAVVGMSEVMVVRTPTATLVGPLAASQQVKQLVEMVGEKISEELA